MVAVASNREPTAFEPLFEAVDPDALDTLVRSNGTSRDVTVTFVFAGTQVTVQTSGAVVVRPVESWSDSGTQ